MEETLLNPDRFGHVFHNLERTQNTQDFAEFRLLLPHPHIVTLKKLELHKRYCQT